MTFNKHHQGLLAGAPEGLSISLQSRSTILHLDQLQPVIQVAPITVLFFFRRLGLVGLPLPHLGCVFAQFQNQL